MRIKLLFVFSVDEKHLVLPKFWAMECYGWVAKLKKLKKQMELSLSFTLQNVENTKYYLHCKPWTFPTNIYWLFYQCLSFLPFFLPIFTDCFTNFYHSYHFLPIWIDCFTNIYHFFTNIYWLFYQCSSFLPIFTDCFTNMYHFLPIFTDCFTNVHNFYHFLPIFTNIVACMGLSFFNW